MMKIITTIRIAIPAISEVRMPLVCVCARPDGAGAGAAGAGAGGELEPLSETGGNVLVAPSGGTGCSVMTLARGNVPLDRGTGVRRGLPSDYRRNNSLAMYF